MTWLREQLDPGRLQILHGSLPPELENECSELRRKLAEIHRRHQAEAEPYIKELAKLEGLRPSKVLYITEQNS